MLTQGCQQVASTVHFDRATLQHIMLSTSSLGSMWQYRCMLVVNMIMLVCASAVTSNANPELTTEDPQKMPGNLGILSWNRTRLGGQGPVQVDNPSGQANFTKEGADLSIPFWIFEVTSYTSCVYAGAFYAPHFIQLVSVGVCSPALYLLVWLVRRALQSLLFVATPWTGASLWGALFETNEWAIMIYMAGAILCVKAIWYLDGCQTRAASHSRASQKSAINGQDRRHPLERSTFGTLPDHAMPRADQEEERDVEGIQLKEAAATGAQAGDGEVDGGGAYSEASPVVQVLGRLHESQPPSSRSSKPSPSRLEPLSERSQPTLLTTAPRVTAGRESDASQGTLAEDAGVVGNTNSVGPHPRLSGDTSAVAAPGDGSAAPAGKPQSKRERKADRKSAKLAGTGGSSAVKAEKPSQANPHGTDKTKVPTGKAADVITPTPQKQPPASTSHIKAPISKGDGTMASSSQRQQPANINSGSTSTAKHAAATAASTTDQQSVSLADSPGAAADTGAWTTVATRRRQPRTTVKGTGHAADAHVPARVLSLQQDPAKDSTSRAPNASDRAPTRGIGQKHQVATANRRRLPRVKDNAATSATTQARPATTQAQPAPAQTRPARRGRGRTAAKQRVPAESVTRPLQQQQQHKGANIDAATVAVVNKAVPQGEKAPAWKTRSTTVPLPKTEPQSSGGPQAPSLNMTSVPTPTSTQSTHQAHSSQAAPRVDPKPALQTAGAAALKAASSSSLPTSSSTYAQMARVGMATSSGIPGYNPEDFEEEDTRLVKDVHLLDELVGHFVEVKDQDVVGNLLLLAGGPHAIRSYRTVAGDGNCGFRAFLVGMVTSAFKSSKSKELLLQSIPIILRSAERWGFLHGGRRENIMQGAFQLKELLVNKGNLSVESLLDACRHEPGPDCKVLFIRAATAAGLRECRHNLWGPIQPALEGEDKRHSKLSIHQWCLKFILPMVDHSDAETRGLRQWDDWCPAALAHMFGATIHVHDIHQSGRDDPCRGGRSCDSPVIRLLRRGNHYDLALK